MSRSFLFAEAFTSSGPRKSGDDRSPSQEVELGEDAGGAALFNGDVGFLWIADGVSDSSKRGPFSSRVLAQDLGRAFASRIPEISGRLLNNEESAASALAASFRESVEEVFADWGNSLTPESPWRQSLLKELNPSAGEGNLLHEFSSTFSVACLQSDGRLSVAGIGDSYLVFNAAAKTQYYSMDRGQATFHLTLDDGQLAFKKFLPPIQEIAAEGVHLAILSSDGTRDVIKYLYETLNVDGAITFADYRKIRKNIGQIKPRTGDDKTLALLARFHED